LSHSTSLVTQETKTPCKEHRLYAADFDLQTLFKSVSEKLLGFAPEHGDHSDKDTMAALQGLQPLVTLMFQPTLMIWLF
jgi:hypothetical protein